MTGYGDNATYGHDGERANTTVMGPTRPSKVAMRLAYLCWLMHMTMTMPGTARTMPGTVSNNNKHNNNATYNDVLQVAS